MDKFYVLTFIKVVNGSLKKVETSVAENFETLHNKMFEDFRGWEIKKKKTLDILSKILN